MSRLHCGRCGYVVVEAGPCPNCHARIDAGDTEPVEVGDRIIREFRRRRRIVWLTTLAGLLVVAGISIFAPDPKNIVGAMLGFMVISFAVGFFVFRCPSCEQPFMLDMRWRRRSSYYLENCPHCQVPLR